MFLVLAPRQPEAFDAVERRAGADGLTVVRRSRPETAEKKRADIFLLDSVGELAGTYALGEAALLGGSFAPKGGHNVLEPLRAGMPVVHGPSKWNIRSVLEVAEGAVFEAADARSAAEALKTLLGDTAARARATAITRELFARHTGAARTAAEAALQLASEGESGA